MTNEQLNKLKRLAEQIKQNEEYLETTKIQYSQLSNASARQACTLHIGGFQIAVTEVDCYTSKVIRGREMLFLGAQKFLAGNIDQFERNIKRLRQQCFEVAQENRS